LKNNRMHVLQAHAYHAGGWYHNDATYVPYLTTAGGMASYDIPNIRLETTALRLNRAPVGPFRGAGIPQGVAVLERVTEQAARSLGLDPDQFRQVRN
jgi:CO/xanthine dehydrogenase Mo-binding subunit